MFVERLSIARKRAKKTQADVGEKLGVGKMAISRYEDGTTPITVEALEMFAAACEVPVSFFFEKSNSTPDLAVTQVDTSTEDRLLAMLERQQAIMIEQQAFMERQRQDVAALTEAIKTQQMAFLAEREWNQKLANKRDEKVEALQATIEELRGELKSVKKSARGRQQLLEPPARPGLAGEG
jgi:transcriptional regulator with XRE-family HTH domain